jgi:hypothetical protein
MNISARHVPLVAEQPTTRKQRWLIAPNYDRGMNVPMPIRPMPLRNQIFSPVPQTRDWTTQPLTFEAEESSDSESEGEGKDESEDEDGAKTEEVYPEEESFNLEWYKDPKQLKANINYLRVVRIEPWSADSMGDAAKGHRTYKGGMGFYDKRLFKGAELKLLGEAPNVRLERYDIKAYVKEILFSGKGKKGVKYKYDAEAGCTLNSK